jgi:hypothetical protein
MSSPTLPSQSGYPSAVAEETRSHDDVSHERLTADYRDLVCACAMLSPDFRDYELTDLPDLSVEDLELIQRTKGLTGAPALQALLADILQECEIRNERKAESRDEDYYGSSSPQTDSERLESQYGLGRTFK